MREMNRTPPRAFLRIELEVFVNASNDSQRRLMAKTAEPHAPTTHSVVKKLCHSSKLQHATAVM